mmetsp:Transcript_109236/g.250649  ORF Transcript_109236/g.250649 Transcript_109236/m.250649 type:complete len:1279 (+) Transcript_109236:31-3867(+)
MARVSRPGVPILNGQLALTESSAAYKRTHILQWTTEDVAQFLYDSVGGQRSEAAGRALRGVTGESLQKALHGLNADAALGADVAGRIRTALKGYAIPADKWVVYVVAAGSFVKRFGLKVADEHKVGVAVTVDDNHTVSDVEEYVSSATGVPPNRMRLQFKGKYLDKQAKLQQISGLGYGAVIGLIHELPFRGDVVAQPHFPNSTPKGLIMVPEAPLRSGSTASKTEDFGGVSLASLQNWAAHRDALDQEWSTRPPSPRPSALVPTPRRSPRRPLRGRSQPAVHIATRSLPPGKTRVGVMQMAAMSVQASTVRVKTVPHAKGTMVAQLHHESELKRLQACLSSKFRLLRSIIVGGARLKRGMRLNEDLRVGGDIIVIEEADVEHVDSTGHTRPTLATWLDMLPTPSDINSMRPGVFPLTFVVPDVSTDADSTMAAIACAYLRDTNRVPGDLTAIVVPGSAAFAKTGEIPRVLPAAADFEGVLVPAGGRLLTLAEDEVVRRSQSIPVRQAVVRSSTELNALLEVLDPSLRVSAEIVVGGVRLPSGSMLVEPHGQHADPEHLSAKLKTAEVDQGFTIHFVTGESTRGTFTWAASMQDGVVAALQANQGRLLYDVTFNSVVIPRGAILLSREGRCLDSGSLHMLASGDTVTFVVPGPLSAAVDSAGELAALREAAADTGVLSAAVTIGGGTIPEASLLVTQDASALVVSDFVWFWPAQPLEHEASSIVSAPEAARGVWFDTTRRYLGVASDQEKDMVLAALDNSTSILASSLVLDDGHVPQGSLVVGVERNGADEWPTSDGWREVLRESSPPFGISVLMPQVGVFIQTEDDRRVVLESLSPELRRVLRTFTVGGTTVPAGALLLHHGLFADGIESAADIRKILQSTDLSVLPRVVFHVSHVAVRLDAKSRSMIAAALDEETQGFASEVIVQGTRVAKGTALANEGIRKGPMSPVVSAMPIGSVVVLRSGVKYGHQGNVVPLMLCSRETFETRKESSSILHSLGIHSHNLVFASDLNTQILAKADLHMVLVGTQQLEHGMQFLQDKVVEIIETGGEHSVVSSSSVSALVADRALQAPGGLPPSVAPLLLAGCQVHEMKLQAPLPDQVNSGPLSAAVAGMCESPSLVKQAVDTMVEQLCNQSFWRKLTLADALALNRQCFACRMNTVGYSVIHCPLQALGAGPEAVGDTAFAHGVDVTIVESIVRRRVGAGAWSTAFSLMVCLRSGGRADSLLSFLETVPELQLKLQSTVTSAGITMIVFSHSGGGVGLASIRLSLTRFFRNLR